MTKVLMTISGTAQSHSAVSLKTPPKVEDTFLTHSLQDKTSFYTQPLPGRNAKACGANPHSSISQQRKSEKQRRNSLLIKVLTLLIKFTNFPFTLAPSFPAPAPKDGSVGVLPHPTINIRQPGLAGPCNSLIRISIKAEEETERQAGNVLRARKRSSERTATALTRRIDTVFLVG